MSPYPPSDFASQAGDKIDAVLETLAFSDDTTVVLSRQLGGKFRATSKSWDEAKVFLPDHVLEMRMIEGRLRIARNDKRRDLGDLQREPQAVLPDGEITEFLGAWFARTPFDVRSEQQTRPDVRGEQGAVAEQQERNMSRQFILDQPPPAEERLRRCAPRSPDKTLLPAEIAKLA